MPPGGCHVEMKKGKRAQVVVVLLLLDGLLAGCASRLPYHDSFEQDRINWFWKTFWFVKSTGGVDDAFSFSGDSSLRVTVNEGDFGQRGRSGQANERSELLERRRHPLGSDLWYSFAVYVPENFPIRNIRLVMGQWKQTSIPFYLKHSPVVAQRFVNGVFSITVSNDSGMETLYQTGGTYRPALVGEWTTFVYHMRFDKGDDGLLEVWMNDEQIVDYRGQLGYVEDFNTTYFRLGLYRDQLEQPMTMYFDDVAVWYGED
jgi:hypothetical protein